MIQDIAPHIYHNEMSWQAPAPDDYVLLFSEKGEVCAGCTDGHLALPTVRLTGAELQQLQYEEIARVLQLDLGTVKSRLYRARNQLREILTARGTFWGEAPSKKAKSRM